jgi:hypothetical protein
MNSVVMPVIHRNTNIPISLDLVPIQPMDAPTANLFYLDLQYNTTPELTFPFWKIKVIFKEK